MSSLATIGGSGVLAVLGGFAVIMVLFVPYVAWSYRRYGTVPPRRALLLVATAVFAVALWTYTVLPLPPEPQAFCAGGGAPAQLRPLTFVQDIRTEGGVGLRNPAVLQVVLNVALFVPLGVLVRVLSGWSLLRVLALGLGSSLLVEITQLTGVWGLYPCPYRLFDVDDLVINTLGAGIGGLLAPVARRLARPEPASRVRPAATSAPVTTGRRLLGMTADVVAVEVVGLVLWAAWLLLQLMADPDQVLAPPAWQQALVAGLLPALGLLLLVPWLTGGSTVGQLATRVRPVRLDGSHPFPRQLLTRFGTGSGGFFVLLAVDDLVGGSPLRSFAQLFGIFSVVVAWRSAGHRGLSGLAAGVVHVDVRSSPDDVPAALTQGRGGDPRRMGMAVLSLAGAVYLVLVLVAALGQASSAVGAVAVLLLAAASVALTLGTAVFLVRNGVTMVRREQRSLGNLLSLLAGGATLVLIGGSVLVMAVGPGWLVVAAITALAVFGYVAFLFVAFVGYGLLYGRLLPPQGVNAVVTLGSGLIGSRVPPLLASRLDRAVTVFEDEQARGCRPLMICSGGRGRGEDVAEATAMAGYLRAKGVPGDVVVEEDQSATTEQNLRLSWALAQHHGRSRLVAVTNDFHAFRTALIARELDVPAQVIGSPTARYFFPSAVLREFVGMLARRRVTYALVGGLVALTTGAASWLVVFAS